MSYIVKLFIFGQFSWQYHFSGSSTEEGNFKIFRKNAYLSRETCPRLKCSTEKNLTKLYFGGSRKDFQTFFQAKDPISDVRNRVFKCSMYPSGKFEHQGSLFHGTINSNIFLYSDKDEKRILEYRNFQRSCK